MRVLLPVLSRRESESAFVSSVTREFDGFVLLAVIDKSEMEGTFAFAAGDMLGANRALEAAQGALAQKGAKVETLLEWGETVPKIRQIALLKRCEKVILQKQSGPRFEALVGALEKEGVSVRVVE